MPDNGRPTGSNEWSEPTVNGPGASRGSGRRAGGGSGKRVGSGPAKPPGRWKRRRIRKKARLAAMSRRKRILRRVGILFGWLVGLFALLCVGFALLLYSVSNVPNPKDIVTNQLATLQYSNGVTIAKVGTENRVDVTLNEIPVQVRNAVLAAEDRNYYSESGVSIRGTVRAALNDLTGGSTQGGSTITQQYVKNAYLNSDQSLSRKLKELAISLKLSRTVSKDEILQDYLNTIDFGRGALGIQAASNAYFGTNVQNIDVAQGALLAAVIKGPYYYDPRINSAAAKQRWQYVVTGMVSTGKLTQAQADALTFPSTIVQKSQSSALDGPMGLVWTQVRAELSAHGITSSEIYAKGLKIQTTIVHTAQTAAESAMKQTYSNLTAQQKNLREALTAVDPSTGAVVAYYGGTDGTGFDYAQAWRAPGSTFKPYVTSTALTNTVKGKKPAYTIKSVFNGASPQTIDGQSFSNDPSDPTSGYYSLTQATTLSLNTVFGKLTSDVGAQNVVDTAHAMGIPKTETSSGPNPGSATLLSSGGTADDYVGIGNYPVRILDQAVGYSTIANGGVAHAAYFVQRVTDASGHVVYTHNDSGTRAIDSKVANDVALSMESVASTSGIGLANGRPVAAKTGTVGIQNSANASDGWTVGFTPQVAASSWVGSDSQAPIYDRYGSPEYGRDMAGNAWKLFMDSYLTGKPVAAMPTKQLVTGGTSLYPTSTPKPSSSAPKSTSAVPTTSAPRTTAPRTTAPRTSTPVTSAPVTTAPVTTPPASTPVTTPPASSAAPPSTSAAAPSTPASSTAGAAGGAAAGGAAAGGAAAGGAVAGGAVATAGGQASGPAG